jgi:glycine oxidase
MEPLQVDFIIVGQGLAGSAVAMQLLKRRRSILVIDRVMPNASSRIATGLFNPITGRNSVKTWLADSLFQYLHKFYQEAESLTDRRFFFSLPLYKPFASIEEQNEWMSRSADPGYANYIESISTRPSVSFVNDQYGGMITRQSGYVDTIGYLTAVRRFIRANGHLLEERFDEDLLIPGDGGVRYKHHTAAHIIFCQGLEASKWFKWVPILPLKGETIRIQSDYSQNIIINRGVYAVPTNQNGIWRVGATYSLVDRLNGITEQARNELMSKLGELVTFPYAIIEQDWGFRPTTHDRRPILGSHPEYGRMHIFNGMGPKGISLTPYFSDILLKYIENGHPLNKDVSIERYKSLYWSPSTRI